MTNRPKWPTADGTLAEALNALERVVPCGYTPGQGPAAEPTALTTLALVAHGREEAGRRGLAWLATSQMPDGRLPVRNGDGPGWGTALGVLAAKRGQAARSATSGGQTFNIESAVGWILSTRGEVQPNGPIYGHNTMLVGWPWETPSHSWIEPTAMNVLALKATGRGGDARTREAILLLSDRLLPGGGCNYGNVTVLGSILRPQVATTGLTLLALADEGDRDGRVARALDYLDSEVSPATTPMSLAYGLMGLAAWGRSRQDTSVLIAASLNRAKVSGMSANLGMALICLAAASSNPLLSPFGAAGSPDGGFSNA